MVRPLNKQVANESLTIETGYISIDYDITKTRQSGSNTLI